MQTAIQLRRLTSFSLRAALAAFLLFVGGSIASASEAQWIWSPGQEGDIPSGSCYFRKTIQTEQPERAEIQITADDAYELYVNGRKVGEGKNWKVMNTHDVTAFLAAGRNTIAVKVTNSDAPSAGLAARVMLKASGGTFVAHTTDATWKTSLKETPNWSRPSLNDSQWLAARVIGPLGQTKPWNDEVQMAGGGGASRFNTHREFRVETAVSPDLTGSLIAMAFNEFGEIVASVEGAGLVLIRDANNDRQLDKPEPICDAVKNCQGILPLNGQLFVTGSGSEGTGFYAVSDTDNDGKFEKAELLIKFSGEMSEHGVHAPILGPDGYIYLVAGNHTKAEKEIAPTSPYRGAIEGDLLPRYEDPRGHAAGIKAPGGVVLRTDTTASFVETFAGGLRNAYDIAFNRNGELFTYDSDMEWDSGMPWYRPTRVNHLTPGGEAGWRSGWAVWPEYYYDSLPATAETGRGSPTGMAFYNHVMYPRRYHDTLFVGDWAGGRILSVRMSTSGGTYRAEVETFVEGRPLNITDLAVGPDGALYFCTGGRGTGGGIYRVAWNGKVPPAMTELGQGLQVAIRHPQLDSAWARQKCAMVKEQLGAKWDEQLVALADDGRAKAEYRCRALDLMQLLGPFPATKQLVRLANDSNEQVRAKAAYLMGMHADDSTSAAVVQLLRDKDPRVQRAACEAIVRGEYRIAAKDVLPLLASNDRFVVYAATKALERLPTSEWKQTVLRAESTGAFLQGALALLNAEPERSNADAILNRNLQLMQGFLSDPDFLDLLRLTELCLIKGKVVGDDIPALRIKLADEYPTVEPRMNRELVRLLAYLGENGANERLLEQLRANIAQEEKMHVAMHLRFFRQWTTNQKFELLTFLEQARLMPGGHSFAGYLENASRDFFAEFSDAERRLVLEEGTKWPSSALSVLAKLPANPGEETLEQVRELDRRLAGMESEAAKKLGIGVIAVLGRSGDPSSMQYLRELYARDPMRRGYIAMALAQHPGGENWPVLVQSLPIVDGVFAQEVLKKLATVDQMPDKPEPVRQVILRGLKLGDNGGDAVALLEKWTGHRFGQAGEKPTALLAHWQQWFAETYPNEPEPTLPTDTGESQWTFDELLSYLTSPEAAKASAERGSTVFAKAQCAQCHRMGDRGEAIGPDLTTIAQRFQKREILESIVHPSQVISDQYASRTLQLVDGRTLTGMATEQADGSIAVLQSDGQKLRLTADQIEEVLPSKKSAMPDGLLNTLTLEEIADLFAYLNEPQRSAITSRRSGAPR